MGGRESKQSCISYEDALKRVSESELHRLKDAFKKSAGVGRLYLSRNAFQQDVLCEGVPQNVTELLYNACGGTSKGISFKDLLCGLVLLTRGSDEEKMRFLWNLYCNDAGTYIVKSDYMRAVNLHPFKSVSLFAQSDRVNFEQFYEWILKNKTTTVLSKWLLSDMCISLTSELETPTFYQSLAGVTHLEEKDIGDLEKEFWRLKNTSPNGQLDLQLLGPLISPPIPKNALVGLFNAFDENRDGHIDFKELCCGVSAACRGPGVERTRFCFKIFDVDRDGVLNHEESLQMINVLLFVAKENRNANLYKDLTRHDAIDDLLTFAARKSAAESAEPAAPMTSENVSLTAEDFMMWSVESSRKLVQPFLDLTFEVCHIVFGLWPQCKHMEYDIVRGWLTREEKRQYRVGQFWYLISHDWWLTWQQYTQSMATPCEYCKRIATQRNFAGTGGCPGAIDEALVCDESFNSSSMDSVGDTIGASDSCSLGSASSGISTGRHCGMRPGPIDNTNLIMPNPFKNVRTLTGEGGHLKRDTPLVQSHDFELVPKSLWKALNRWYGDNLPLPRQVIQPPNSSEVELELYPLNLRILLHQTLPNASALNSWGAASGGYGVMGSGGGYAAISASSVLQPPKRYLAYTAAFSRLATVRQIGEFLCEQLRLKTEDIRLWHIQAGSMENSAILLEEDNMSLKELLIRDNDQLLLEIRNKDLTWPEELSSLSLAQGGGSGACGTAANDRRLTRTSIMSVHAPGATGLHNLGNTCFMNAALQVLFNTQPLAQYFRRSMHLFELNTANKLGTRGQLAMRYGELLKEVWSSTTRSVAPLKLRFCVTKHAPQFAGGGQHDSQELLEWFLDALHEDLNRVMEKPYSELKDSNGRPDKVVAAEAWAQHHARNQSIVIDLFYGQLKSKVSCLGCGRESVRFDPFSLLSLPLPVENYVYFEVLVILLDGAIPTKYGLRLNSEEKYIDLKRKLAPLCYLNPSFMLVCEIWNSQIRQILPDEQKLNASSSKELYVYQLPEDCSERSRSSSTLGMSIEKGLKDIQRSSALISGQDSLTSLNQMQSILPYNIATTTTTTIAANIKTNLTSLDMSMRSNSLYDNGALGACATNATATANVATVRNDDNEHAADDDDDDEDDHVATKHSPVLGRSPENTFVNSSHKRKSSTKLLYTESTSSSFTNHSGDNSMESCGNGDGTGDSHCPCGPDVHCRCARFNSTALSSPGGDACAHHHHHNDVDDDDSDGGGGDYTNDSENDDRDGDEEGAAPDNGSMERRQSASKETALAPRATRMKRSAKMKPCAKASGSGASAGLFSRVPSHQYRVGHYLLAVHRKITRQDSYFLSHHKTQPSLFGVPLLIPSGDGDTSKDLYCAVWLQVSRLLSPLPAAPDQANHAADCDDSLGYDFPFTLRAVKSDGLTCAFCAWSNFCRGCEIPCNNEYVLHGALPAGGATSSSNCSTPKMATKFSSLPNLEARPRPPDLTTSLSHNAQPPMTSTSGSRYCDDFTIAIDWDPTALHLRYQSTLERLWTDHESVAQCRREQVEPVDLNHCLRAFTSEEKLEQWYHCSHCKGKKPATKKLQIWKLPPILIVHLKRFNCVNGKWVKSQKVVHFPFDDFDPTPYLASVPQETIWRHRELLELQKIEEDVAESESAAELHSSYTTTQDNGNIIANHLDNGSALQKQNNSAPKLDNCSNVIIEEEMFNQDTNQSSQRQSQRTSSSVLSTNGMPTDTVFTNSLRSRNERRKRLISSSLTKTPIVDGEFEDFHQHQLKSGEDKFDPKYKLYAVVSHSGMLNGGHYISYAANDNGSWYCYNDSSCREICTQPNIDPSSAYLLFYERRGLDYEPYLPNIEGRTLPNGGVGLELDDGDNDLKKLCAIS